MKKGVSSLADTWLTILAGARSKFGLSRYIMSTTPPEQMFFSPG
jgi:hypothetical protein